MPVGDTLRQAYATRETIALVAESMLCRHSAAQAMFLFTGPSPRTIVGGGLTTLPLSGTFASPVYSFSVTANADDLAIVSYEVSCSASAVVPVYFSLSQNGVQDFPGNGNAAVQYFEGNSVNTTGIGQHIHRIGVFTPAAGSNTYTATGQTVDGSTRTLYIFSTNIRVFLLRRT